MAKHITQRTLCGYTNTKANIYVYSDIIEDMKEDAKRKTNTFPNTKKGNKLNNLSKTIQKFPTQ